MAQIGPSQVPLGVPVTVLGCHHPFGTLFFVVQRDQNELLILNCSMYASSFFHLLAGWPGASTLTSLNPSLLFV